MPDQVLCLTLITYFHTKIYLRLQKPAGIS